MFRFLHAADIHLDSPHVGLDRYEGAPAAECRGATRQALENLVDLALKEQVAFVVIVGDLYDGDWQDFNTCLFFGKQMVRLRDSSIPVIMIWGNHDAASTMTRHLRLVDNVRVLSSEKPETFVLEERGVAVHGQSFPTRAVTANLAKSYPARRQGYFNLGLLHTSVDGREGHEHYAPCSLNDLRVREYAYWALGHVHRREVLSTDDTWVVFPGNLQGRHVREAGAKGCTLVTVSAKHEVLSAEPRWLDVVRWETCRLSAQGAADGEEIIARFQTRLSELLRVCEDRLLALRVEVAGATRAHEVLQSYAAHWNNEFRQAALDAGNSRVWIEKVMLCTKPLREHAEDTARDAPLAELLALLDELRGDDSQLTALGTRALGELTRKLPAEVLDGLDSPEHLRSLLEQAGPMLFERLAKV
jgi:DNA repair exonuclease SbcCD nuclease subunit